MQMILPSDVRAVLQALIDKGYEAYCVGGCVRDTLLHRDISDWDICTSALPEQTIECFPDCNIIETGIKHGTVTVMYNDVGYEITTFRIDLPYSDGRHPDMVVFTRNLEADLERRDFTINAIACDINGNLIDPFQGCDDLVRRIIRCVGNPEMRFREDHLRILRGVRFVATLGFTIDQYTEICMRAARHNINSISAERINSEFCKIISGRYVVAALSEHRDIIAAFMPEIVPMFGCKQHNPYHIYDVWEHTVKAMGYMYKDDLITRLAVFFHDIGKPDAKITGADGFDHFYEHAELGLRITYDIMRRLRFSNDYIGKVCDLVKYHDYRLDVNCTYTSLKRLVSHIGMTQYERLAHVKYADNLAQSNLGRDMASDNMRTMLDTLDLIKQNDAYMSVSKLKIDGNGIIGLGVSPGPIIGSTLIHLLEQVISDNIPNENQHLLEAARKYISEVKGCDI